MARSDYRLLHFAKEAEIHTHEYAHVLLPVNLPVDLLIDGKRHILTKDEIGFVAPNVPHSCLCDGELIVMNIPRFMMKTGDLEILSSRISTPTKDSLSQLIGLIRAEMQRDNPSMRYLYYYLYERMVEQNSFVSLRYIREHFDEPIQVSELASMEGFSISYFNDWFKQQTGYTPSYYLKLFRIEKARELLSSSNYNILDIALQVGYENHSSFTRAFREVVGIPPAQYRGLTDQDFYSIG